MADRREQSVRELISNRRELGYSLCKILGLPMTARYLILGVVSRLRNQHGLAFSNEETAATLITALELDESKREEMVQALNESDSRLAELGLSTIVSLEKSSMWMALAIALELNRYHAPDGDGTES